VREPKRDNLPRLETGLRLWAVAMPGDAFTGTRDQAMLMLEGLYLLCRGGECTGIPVLYRVKWCGSERCLKYVWNVTGDRGATAVSTVKPASAKPDFGLPVELEEVERLASETYPLPSCARKTHLSYMEEARKVLEGVRGVRDPNGKWIAYMVDGGLVVDGKSYVAVFCFRPECDPNLCGDMEPWSVHPITASIAKNRKALREVAIDDLEVLLAIIATASSRYD